VTNWGTSDDKLCSKRQYFAFATCGPETPEVHPHPRHRLGGLTRRRQAVRDSGSVGPGRPEGEVGEGFLDDRRPLDEGDGPQGAPEARPHQGIRLIGLLDQSRLLFAGSI
jgi:hypothetical protein